MIQQAIMEKKEICGCQLCGKILRGRVDKKFCNDHCRNSFNNKLKSSSKCTVRNINNALSKNRRILEYILGAGDEPAKANKDRLIQLGFQFRYLTHLYTTRNGKVYYYCYDHGYLPLDKDWYLVVKKKKD
jgi:hypothetical protein